MNLGGIRSGPLVSKLIQESILTKSAVLLIIFNRPETTIRVLRAIEEARPPRLYIAGDGPRSDVPEDKVLVEEARAVIEKVEWPCEIRTLYHDSNLGSKEGPARAISWFFEHEPEGVILEDDCLPHLDFFTFCDEILEKYRNDDRVMTVTGNNFQGNRWRGSGTYYFSRYHHSWGWATWKRAWRHYDPEIAFWSQFKVSRDWRAVFSRTEERHYWERIFDKVYAREFETAWDYPWTASIWKRKGLTATPNVNLVSNIGFGKDATHTLDASSKLARLPVKPMGKVRHPLSVTQNQEADEHTFNVVFALGAFSKIVQNLRSLAEMVIKYATPSWRDRQ
jgi:hypothetical protein